MCGIIAYKGIRNAFPILVDGLKKLEYRGYDSFGILTVPDDFDFVKKIGAISEAKINELKSSNLGIGHTRWATHGGVNDINAHPHFSCDKSLAIVHNGVVENIDEIKNIIKGHNIISETDTELIVHLVEEFEKNASLKEAVINTARLIKGRNSFVIIDKKSKDLFACKKGSPLAIGVKGKEYFASSDLNALYGMVDEVVVLNDNELAIFDSKLEFYDILTGKKIAKKKEKTRVFLNSSELGNYEHFMLKEIFEQKDTLTRAIDQNEDLMYHISNLINHSEKLLLVGCGSAHKVCIAASYLLLKKKPTFAVVASEFHNYLSIIDKKTLVIAVSQSGETADTLEALEMAKSKGAKCLCIVNMEGSTMSRLYQSIMTNSGPEIAVASTKATTAQFAVLSQFAEISPYYIIELENNIMKLLDEKYLVQIKRVAEKIVAEKRDVLYIIGKDMNYAVALEAGIKMQEVGYINALCFSGGELKHGPLALITKDSICIVIGDDKDIITNAIEAKARGAHIIGVNSKDNDIYDTYIKAPNSIKELSFISNLVPIQLLAYYISILKGINPDKPRNLAKSVTVK